MSRGIKDCSHCVIPHREEGYDHIREAVDEMIFRKAQV
jgi:Zn-finger protein